MWRRFVFGMLIVVYFGGYIFCDAQNIQAKELVINPTFKSTGEHKLPGGWTTWKPVLDKTACRFESIDDGLLVKAAGDPYAVGGVFQEVRGIKSGQAYAIKAISQHS